MLGKARFQRAFEKLYEASLAGQNFGEGNHPRLSGEGFVMRYVRANRSRRRSTIIFDVGANVGIYTLELIEVFGDSAFIWSFEPAPSAFILLSQNVSGIENVKACGIGFSNEESVATLFSPAEASKLASLYDPSRRLNRMGIAVDRREHVTLTTIDRFCEREGVDHVDFLKLDVEGHELKVLEGAEVMMRDGRIDFLQFEFGAANIESRTYFRDFFQLLDPYYAIHRVIQDALYPVPRYKEIYEVYKRATNYLAVRRALESS